MEKLQGHHHLVIGIAALMVVGITSACVIFTIPVGFDERMELLTSSMTAALANAKSRTPSPPGVLTLPPATWSTVAAYPLPSQAVVMVTATSEPDVATSTLRPVVAPTLMQPTSGPSQTSPAVAQDVWCIPWNARPTQATVLRVIDGVTIEASVAGETVPVRYIGIDLLDYASDWTVWDRATAKNRELVEGKSVLLIEGVSLNETDELLLRYVISEGVFVNQELLKAGYVAAQNEPDDPSCAAAFRAAQAEAVQARRGLWAATPTPTRTQPPPTEIVPTTGQLVIVNVAYRGSIWQEPEEYVEVTNSGIMPIQLEGWSVSDLEYHRFVFPNFILQPGQFCRVYTDLYRPKNCGMSFFNPSPIWDNGGDCAVLKDATGRKVDEFCYP